MIFKQIHYSTKSALKRMQVVIYFDLFYEVQSSLKSRRDTHKLFTW